MKKNYHSLPSLPPQVRFPESAQHRARRSQSGAGRHGISAPFLYTGSAGVATPHQTESDSTQLEQFSAGQLVIIVVESSRANAAGRAHRAGQHGRESGQFGDEFESAASDARRSQRTARPNQKRKRDFVARIVGATTKTSQATADHPQTAAIHHALGVAFFVLGVKFQPSARLHLSG